MTRTKEYEFFIVSAEHNHNVGVVGIPFKYTVKEMLTEIKKSSQLNQLLVDEYTGGAEVYDIKPITERRDIKSAIKDESVLPKKMRLPSRLKIEVYFKTDECINRKDNEEQMVTLNKTWIYADGEWDYGVDI